TSATTGSTEPAGAWAAVSSSGARRRPAPAIRQPASASASVMWRPRPEPAPVTTATPLVVMNLTVGHASVRDADVPHLRERGPQVSVASWLLSAASGRGLLTARTSVHTGE